jgi:hypothetical protein
MILQELQGLSTWTPRALKVTELYEKLTKVMPICTVKNTKMKLCSLGMDINQVQLGIAIKSKLKDQPCQLLACYPQEMKNQFQKYLGKL